MKLFVRILLGVAALLLALVIGAAAVVATIDKRTLLAPLVTQVEKATGRALTIGGEPRIDLSLTPTLVMEDVTLANAPWGSAKEMLRAKRIEVDVALLPLLSRRLDLKRFTLVEPVLLLETDRNGGPNWTFGASRDGAPATGAPHAAGALALGELGIERGEVTYRDGRTGATTPIRIERLLVRGRPDQPLVAKFKGSVAQVPIDLEGAFGPLAALRDGKWPWPISVKGEVAGRKAEVATQLEARREVVAARELALTLGTTRATGSLAWQKRGERTLLNFDLDAEMLQAADLALVAAAGVRPAAPQASDGRVFPATPVAFDPLRSIDAQGKFAIGTLVMPDGRKFGPVAASVALDRGRLVLDDLAVTAYGGTTRGRLSVDAREATPVLSLRLEAKGLDLAALLAAAGVQRSIQGAKTDLALDLDMRGTSPRAWASSATGTATARVGAGSIPAGSQGLTTELRQLVDALNPTRQSTGRTELACAVVRLPLRAGVARIDRSIAVETRELGASASGTVDLRNETLDLTFAPRVRAGIVLDLGSLAGAVRLRGPLDNPVVAVDPVGAAVAVADARALLRGGAAALLGARPGAPGGGNECAVALGAVPPPVDKPQPAAPARSGTARDAEQALRRLFGR